jgi:hypothetical protein
MKFSNCRERRAGGELAVARDEELGSPMRTVVRGLGWLCMVLAALLVLLGLTTLPSGGLMFALPYVFLIPGVLFGVVGWALLRFGRRPTDGADRRGDGFRDAAR